MSTASLVEKWKTAQKLNLGMNDAILDNHYAECYSNKKNEDTINMLIA